MFKPTMRCLYQIIGKTKLSDLSSEWIAPVTSCLDAEEKAVSDQVVILYFGIGLYQQDPNFKMAEIR